MSKKFTEALAANYLGIATTTIQKWRRTGKGPEFYRLGRKILYAEEDLAKFLERNKFSSTSEYNNQQI